MHAATTAQGGGVKSVLVRLKRGPSLRTEGAARGFAVASTLAGSPRLALAGLLTAIRLDPADRMNFVNAAAPLAMLGKPADAIAPLSHAAKMRGPLPAVMGLPGAAVLQNNRGYAYSKLKDHSAAISALKKALSAAPAMAEANTNLGGALLCAGRTAEALKVMRAGLARNKLTYVSPAPAGAAAIADQFPTVPLAAQVADLSAGKDGVIPAYVTPASPGQWAALHGSIAAMGEAASAENQAISTARTTALEQTKTLPGSIATKMRSSSLANLVNTSLAEPPIKSLHEKALDALKAADKVATDHWAVAVPAKSNECSQGGDWENCFPPWCRATTASVTGSYNGAITAAESSMREYWRVAGKRETGLAANISDQPWHDVAMSDARSNGLIGYQLLISSMQTWVGPLKFFENVCVNAPEPAPASADNARTAESPGACPPALAGLTGSFKHGVEIPPAAGKEKPSKLGLTFKVSCSKAEVELSQKVAGTAGLISVFGKGEVDFKTDTTTLVVGAKGSAGGLLTGQSGFYVTTGRSGVEDFGWRVGAGSSPFGVKVWGGTENVSFVGSIDYIPTAFGFGGANQ